MKINYCCGRQVLDGWHNIDAAASPRAPRPPELLFTLRFKPDGQLVRKTPLDDDCATELQAMHVIEHFHVWQAPHVLAEWKRLLQPGGLLVLELPNLEAACRNVLAGLPDQMGMWPLFGDGTHMDPLNCHKFGYTPSTIIALVKAAGFIKAKVLPPITHGARQNRDMRIECIKPNETA